MLLRTYYGFKVLIVEDREGQSSAPERGACSGEMLAVSVAKDPYLTLPCQ